MRFPSPSPTAYRPTYGDSVLPTTTSLTPFAPQSSSLFAGFASTWGGKCDFSDHRRRRGDFPGARLGRAAETMEAAGFAVHGAAPFQKTSRRSLRFTSLLSTSASYSQLPRAALHGQDQDAFYIVQGSALPPAYRRHGQEPLEMLQSTDWTRSISLQTSRTEKWHIEIQNLKAKKNNVRHSILNPMKLKGSAIKPIAQRVDDFDDCHDRNADAHVLFSSSGIFKMMSLEQTIFQVLPKLQLIKLSLRTMSFLGSIC